MKHGQTKIKFAGKGSAA